MLKKISPLLGPDLLAALCRMGHGEEILLADAHFPAESCRTLLLRADGISIPPLLAAILPLFELDSYVAHPVLMMRPEPQDLADPGLADSYRQALAPPGGPPPAIALLDRTEFYERARQAFAVVVTGELRKYGNIILKKGVTPVADNT